jgi:hypothetical protein
MQPPPTHPAYTPAQSNHISTASIDRILMQAPTTGHAMFSNTSPKKANSNARHLSLSDLTRHLPTFGQFQSSENFSMETSFETPSQKRKDRSSAPADTPSPHGQPPKRPKPSLTNQQKLDRLFDLFKELDWTLGEALHHVFAHKGVGNAPLHRSQRHGNIVENYLAGRSTYTVPGILESWLTSPYGRGYTEAVMFDTDTPYPEIRPVRQALSAFAVQSCSDFLEHKSSAAVKSSGGLWAAIGQGKKDEKSVEWQDLRTAIQEATRNLRKNQRLAVHFLHIIAEPKPRSRKGILTVRNSRPRENVRPLFSPREP